MKLLEKTRKINKLLQKGDKVEFNAIAKLLRDVIEANTYIVGRKGGVKGYALIQRIGNLAGAFLLLLGLTAFIQQLATDLENFLIQRVGRHSR